METHFLDCMAIPDSFQYLLVPSAPPVNFTITVIGPRTLEFSWSPPPEEERNGLISGYTLSCQPDSQGLPITVTSAGIYNVSGFTPATLENCSIYAFTSIGPGPSSNHVVMTGEDGKFLSCVMLCLHQ